MPEGSKSRIRFSKLYSFSCLKSPFRDGHSQIGRKGYSRVVYCNDPDNPEAVQLNYGGNYVSTTKYTAFNFIPKSLFEQFRRVANIYFLVVACVSFSPLAPFTALSIVAPLLVVIGATMAKEAVEDWRRRKQQILLRDSKLKNTDYIYGIVIFTGHDTKVMQNSTDPPSKRSKIERKMDKIIYILFSTLVLISFIGSVFFGVETKRDISSGRYRRWYLRPDNTTVFYDPRRATLAAVLHFLTALMLYGYLIPISLYVSIELVKVLQSIFINHDQEMYFEETDRPARARTSNLNEELGQVDTILSDKTGTLTCNSMEFVKCSIGGIPYGRGMTEVEKALVRRGSDVESEVDGGSSDILGQIQVPECIEKLARAKIKLWVLTGDKMETAVNIGYACSLLRQDMKQIVITLDSPDILSLEKQGDKEALSKASLESIKKQIREGISQIKSAKESSNTNKGSSSGFGLIIDGKSLDYSLNKNLERSFFELAINCASVICCRSSPKQKARVSTMGSKVSQKLPSTSLVVESVIYGRDDDREMILNWLTSETDSYQLTKIILEAITKSKDNSRELEMIHGRLKEKLTGKRFLLVLDDVWNERREEWESVQTPLNHGAPGSRILVTTRCEEVVCIMRLRTFMPASREMMFADDPWKCKMSLHELFSKFKFLRALSLSGCSDFREVPDSVGELIHLRSLDFSLSGIKILPESTCLLYNLQTLKLNYCRNLEELPSNLHKLSNLHCLKFVYTIVRKMPMHLGKLKNLQVLSIFFAGKSSKFSTKQLGELNLHGKLLIGELQNIVNPSDALAADLKNKTHLVKLELEWNSNHSPDDPRKEREVLENL
ncbi:hypothetical protein JHK85_011746 [Glycine max]|nr:hypothetical protein JHK85_011746 [Glycine max]